jgi:GT2 family glycosyltransferase
MIDACSLIEIGNKNMFGPDVFITDSNHTFGHNISPKDSPGCGHIIRLIAAKEINFYTPNPGFYGTEEKDLSIRLVDKGYKVVFYKGVYVWHDKTPIARDLNKQHRSGVCNDLVFSYRRTPALFLWPTLILQIAKHLKFALTYKHHNFIPACKQGVNDFLKWLVTKETDRKAVSMAGFIKFIKARK